MQPVSRTETAIPTCHTPFHGDSIDAFAEWLESDLLDLEYRFSDFWTNDSLKKSVKAERKSLATC